MFVINENNSIEITRGDTAYITVSIPDYKFKIDDIIKFGVKKRATDTDFLILKTITVTEETEAVVVKILPEDTKQATFGKYVYDVEFINGITKDVNTIITINDFVILKEVS